MIQYSREINLKVECNFYMIDVKFRLLHLPQKTGYIAQRQSVRLLSEGSGFRYSLYPQMVSGSAWSGRLPVTQYKQEGSNPFGTAFSGSLNKIQTKVNIYRVGSG